MGTNTFIFSCPCSSCPQWSKKSKSKGIWGHRTHFWIGRHNSLNRKAAFRTNLQLQFSKSVFECKQEKNCLNFESGHFSTSNGKRMFHTKIWEKIGQIFEKLCNFPNCLCISNNEMESVEVCFASRDNAKGWIPSRYNFRSKKNATRIGCHNNYYSFKRNTWNLGSIDHNSIVICQKNNYILQQLLPTVDKCKNMTERGFEPPHPKITVP